MTAIEHLPIQLHRLQVNKLNEVFKLRSDTIMCEFRRIIDSLPALTTLKFWEKEEEPNSHELAELANKIPLVDEMMGSL